MKQYVVAIPLSNPARLEFVTKTGDYVTWAKDFQKAWRMDKRSATYIQENLNSQYKQHIQILSIEK